MSSSITLPESYVWDYIKVRREVEDSADDYLADETIGIVFMSDPAWLLNEAFVGGDQNRRHGMYLTYQVKELTLPDFKNYDGSSIFTFPRDLPLMMVYFPIPVRHEQSPAGAL